MEKIALLTEENDDLQRKLLVRKHQLKLKVNNNIIVIVNYYWVHALLKDHVILFPVATYIVTMQVHKITTM